MSLTPSTMLKLKTKAPDFSLTDVVTQKNITLSAFEKKKLLLVMFICRHCPYVQHIKTELARLGQDYRFKGAGIIAISSNDAQNYPEDSPRSLREFAEEIKLDYPLCYDESQTVAKAYTAACTPDFFLFDQDHKLVYRGQMDDSRPGNGKPVTGRDLRSAMDSLLLGIEPSPDQKPSLGCNIKWKAGNEPEYFKR
jgi:peroxiredoxin